MNWKSLFAVVVVGLWACGDANPDPAAFRQACAAGDAKSCQTLGFWHQTGFFGVTQDLTHAVDLYRQACLGGEMGGCYSLAAMYETGEGVTQDLAHAVNLYQQACDGGEMGGCYSLAAMYETGEGVTRDPAAAAHLYQLACDGAQMGCSQARVLGGVAVPVPERAIFHTPYTAAPYVLNRPEVIRAISREYPQHLRRAGVTGTVTVYFFIGANGTVEDIRLDQSSGNVDLDRAALRVAEVYEFGAAYYRVSRVSVWLSLPITF